MDESYTALHTYYTAEKDVNVLIRFTAEDTEVLLTRLRDAVSMHTGATIAFMGMQGAFSLVRSDNQGRQIKCIALNKSGFRINTPMKGYNQPWTHIEMAIDEDKGQKHMSEFLRQLGQYQEREKLL